MNERSFKRRPTLSLNANTFSNLANSMNKVKFNQTEKLSSEELIIKSPTKKKSTKSKIKQTIREIKSAKKESEKEIVKVQNVPRKRNAFLEKKKPVHIKSLLEYNHSDSDEDNKISKEHLLEIKLIELLSIKNKTLQDIKEISSFIYMINTIKAIINKEPNPDIRKHLQMQLANGMELEVKPPNSVVTILGGKGYKLYTILNGLVSVIVTKKISVLVSKNNFLFWLLKLKYFHETETFNKALDDNISKNLKMEKWFVNLFYELTLPELEHYYNNSIQIDSNALAFLNLMDKIEELLKKYANNKDDIFAISNTKKDISVELISENSQNDIEYKNYFNVSPVDYCKRLKILEEKNNIKALEFYIYVYFEVATKKNRDVFGEIALEKSDNKRTATTIAILDNSKTNMTSGISDMSKTYFATIKKEVFDECLKAASIKMKEEKFQNITKNSFLNHLNLITFGRLEQFFIHYDINKGEKITDEKILKNKVLNIEKFTLIKKKLYKNTVKTSETIDKTQDQEKKKKPIKKVKVKKRINYRAKHTRIKKNKFEGNLKRQKKIIKAKKKFIYYSDSQIEKRNSNKAEFLYKKMSLKSQLLLPYKIRAEMKRESKIELRNSLKNDLSLNLSFVVPIKKKSSMQIKKQVDTKTLKDLYIKLVGFSPKNKPETLDLVNSEKLDNTNQKIPNPKISSNKINNLVSMPANKLTKVIPNRVLDIDKSLFQNKRRSSSLVIPQKNYESLIQLKEQKEILEIEENNVGESQYVYFITKGFFSFYTNRSLKELCDIMRSELSLDSPLYNNINSIIYKNEEQLKFDHTFEKYYNKVRKFKFQNSEGYEIVGLEDCFLLNNNCLFNVECESSIGEFYKIKTSQLAFYLLNDCLANFKKKEMILHKRSKFLKKIEELYISISNRYRWDDLDIQKDSTLKKIDIYNDKHQYNLDNNINSIGVTNQDFIKLKKLKIKLEEENKRKNEDSKNSIFNLNLNNNIIDYSLFKQRERGSIAGANKNNNEINVLKATLNLNFSERNGSFISNKRSSNISMNFEEDEFEAKMKARVNPIQHSKLKPKDAIDIKLDNALIKSITAYVNNTQNIELNNKVDVIAIFNKRDADKANKHLLLSEKEKLENKDNINTVQEKQVQKIKEKPKINENELYKDPVKFYLPIAESKYKKIENKGINFPIIPNTMKSDSLLAKEYLEKNDFKKIVKKIDDIQLKKNLKATICLKNLSQDDIEILKKIKQQKKLSFFK